jgi:hypothetical protein
MKQLSEEYRRGIIMPLDDKSEKQMRSFYFDSKTKFDSVLINEKNNLFFILWESRLFDKINSKTGLTIDNYETEIAEPQYLKEILSIVKNYNKLNSGDEFSKFITDFRRLLLNAIDLNRPICFVF